MQISTVDPSKLVIGNCYFLTSFFDKKRRFPGIETYVFVGTNLLEDFTEKRSYWYFQDPDSYEEQGVFTKLKDKSSRDVLRIDEESIEMFVDYDGLFAFLTEVRKNT